MNDQRSGLDLTLTMTNSFLILDVKSPNKIVKCNDKASSIITLQDLDTNQQPRKEGLTKNYVRKLDNQFS